MTDVEKATINLKTAAGAAILLITFCLGAAQAYGKYTKDETDLANQVQKVTDHYEEERLERSKQSEQIDALIKENEILKQHVTWIERRLGRSTKDSTTRLEPLSPLTKNNPPNPITAEREYDTRN